MNGLIKENIVDFKKMLNIYNCEAQIGHLHILHPLPAKPNRPARTKFKIELGFFFPSILNFLEPTVDCDFSLLVILLTFG